MQLKTFSAATMAEALTQVKTTLGHDAVILHTRTYQRRRWLGLKRQEIVEITAGTGLNVGARTPRRPVPAQNPLREATQRKQLAASAYVQTSTVAARPVATAQESSHAPRHLLETPAANHAVMMNINQEMTALKAMVMDLVTATRKNSSPPQVPEDLLEYYLQLIENHVAQELAADLVKTLQLQLRPEHLKNEEFVREKLAEQIEKLLPSAGPIVRKKAVGPHVVALIGPTGVGKTTTIAKLAANLKLHEHHRVGLITIDTYRIAAVDQLRKYADIIGSPLRVVNTPEDLRAAVEAMSDCEFILIDTAGRSPTDTLKLNELKSFLNAAQPDEVHLVVSSTASQECMEAAIARFGDVRVDKIIFTKLDEAVHVGVVFNVMRKVNKALSYVTTGQDVPDDIEVGKGRKLAQLILKSSGTTAGISL